MANDQSRGTAGILIGRPPRPIPHLEDWTKRRHVLLGKDSASPSPASALRRAASAKIRNRAASARHRGTFRRSAKTRYSYSIVAVGWLRRADPNALVLEVERENP